MQWRIRNKMENFQDLLTTLSVVVPIVGGMCTGIMIIYHKIYNKGKKEAIDDNCAKRIEENITTIDGKLDSLTTEIRNHVQQDEKDFAEVYIKFEKEDEKTDKQHNVIYDKINEAKEDISEMKGMLTMIRDKLNE